jgi:hypothetical protein
MALICAITQVLAHAAVADNSDTGVRLVQFIHPGGEHEPDSEDARSWNTGAHKRKFIKLPGQYLTVPDGQSTASELVFWAEWEPSSQLIKTFAAPAHERPRFLYAPVLEPFRDNTPPLMNTDPFVYGDHFFYGICKQNTRKGPTQLQRLEKGSVILFGSGKSRRFILDTVFVVADYVDYTPENYREVLKDRVPPEYFTVSLDPIAYEMKVRGQSTMPFRLYIGATYHQPYEGMFSFFPCRPYSAGDEQGFARPVIRREGLITDNLTQGQRLNRISTADEMRELWSDVTRQILDQGLHLGVYAEIPRASN